MRISLSEIWNFADIIKDDEKGWSFSLKAGNAMVENVSLSMLHELRDDHEYNTELLPEIFTFREILWQPDTYTDAAMSLPGLRILTSYCHEMAEEFKSSSKAIDTIYAQLLESVEKEATTAIDQLTDENTAATVKQALSALRTNAFPIIKFFISHPRNRLDYYRDAVNRLNYAVKVMLTQFNGKYSELEDAHWQVIYSKKVEGLTTKKEGEKKSGAVATEKNGCKRHIRFCKPR